MRASDRTDAAWAAQVGPALSEDDVARLLRQSARAVRADERLLRVVNRDGRTVYPVAQFDAKGQVPGVADIVILLKGSLQPLTISSWLTAPNQGLAERTPIQALRAGDDDAMLTLARRLSNATGH